MSVYNSLPFTKRQNKSNYKFVRKLHINKIFDEQLMEIGTLMPVNPEAPNLILGINNALNFFIKNHSHNPEIIFKLQVSVAKSLKLWLKPEYSRDSFNFYFDYIQKKFSILNYQCPYSRQFIKAGQLYKNANSQEEKDRAISSIQDSQIINHFLEVLKEVS